ncbi:MAG: tyrosine-protein phosphatase [Propionicimonas sp.]|uniref:tyrosine-protein phosphatase n=1 Tax=Propionicimonas sp. TaxID=1955623 RepID=UPI002B1EA8F5|nr:tyrosine-protein phosphatase [Propionicimonas sp.]MEA4943560.1 tyrosine-protein phosphatase [Propionicimonas sp.]MEA5051854.1 tyrosine-protein phosphatase [Propionicimonas sp.]MEA5116399.1 tyrosine-protein phosphatase [Propionicimonas sp.]
MFPTPLTYPAASAPQRRIFSGGTYNARDAGRYPIGTSGGSMHGRRLFRADALSDLTEADLTEADGLGIKLVVDLRDPHERDNAPDVEIPGARNASIMLFEGTLAGFRADSYPSLEELYQYILTDHRHKVAEALEQIAETLPSPVLVHCTAGKDRTGIVVGMIQELVGVPHQWILQDYEASQHLLNGDFIRRVESVYARAHVDARKIGAEPIASPAQLLGTTLERIRAEFGSVQGYLVDAGLPLSSVEQIRRTLTV